MTPDQRANYLEWLASGRTAPLHDIGYAFVFFYGLERRALVDGRNLQEAILETLRLIDAYPGSGSFFNYLSNFVAYALAHKGLARLPEQWFRRIFLEGLADLNDDSLAVALAWICFHERPLPAALAFQVAKQDVRSPRSVVVKRTVDQFRELFRKKYEATYGDGMKIRPAAASRDRNLEYRPASPSLLELYSQHRFKPVRLPNPLGVQSQFKPLVGIWTECIEDLRRLSRKLAEGQGALTREAFRALPEALKAEAEHPDKPHWDTMVAEHAREDGLVVVTAGVLAALQDIPKRPKLTLKQSLDLAETAQDIGFALVPDPRVLRRSYDWDDPVAVLSREEESEPLQETNYVAAALMLQVGMAMAAADGKLDREEILHVSLGLKSQFKLDRYEARKLEAYREILIQKPPTLRSLSRFVRNAFDSEQREALGQFLVGVAAVDGIIEKAERRALESAYKAFAVPVAKLHALLQEIEGPADEPVVVQETEVAPRGEVIPIREASTTEPRVKLNQDLINRILGETATVAAMIGEAMGDVEEAAREAEPAEDPAQAEALAPEQEDAPESEPAEVAAAPPVFEGLDARYHSALAELITRREWSRADFDALARRHGLMPAAMVEVINSWTDERFGDFLIEEGDPYVVQVELLEAA